MTVLVWITRITVPTPVRICPAILSMDNPDSRNRSTSPRPKMRFGRPMALQIFVLPGARPSAVAQSPRPGSVHHGADVGLRRRGGDSATGVQDEAAGVAE